MQHGFQARPVSKKELALVATKFRQFLNLQEVEYFPVAEVLEIALPRILDGYVFRVVEHAEMLGDHGRTAPDNLEIWIREDVYDGLCRGAGRDRFTGAHELGHLVLHTQRFLSRRMGDHPIKTYCDPEWQANSFAASLLMPEDMVRRCQFTEEIMNRFGVSHDAASLRAKQLSMQMKEAF